MNGDAFEIDEVAGQLRRLGVVGGGVLLVHTSYRATRPIVDGPAGLIAALREAIGAEGTLVMPSWGGDVELPFDPLATPVAEDLGVVAETFWRLPGVVRSDHSEAFAAVGPAARSITRDPLPLPPHIPASPVGRVLDLDGQILLIGVGHDANSTLHLAEVLAGVPYGIDRHCTVLREGRRVSIPYRENDHCCAKFSLADQWLRDAGAQSEGPVGNAHSRLVRSRELVDAALERLAADPLIFLHAPSDRCADCDEARSSIVAKEKPAPRGAGPGQ